MTLVEFLLARIAEDEETNDGMVRSEVASCRADGMPNLTEEEIREFWGEQAWWRRRLAECEAKRRIVRKWQRREELLADSGQGPMREVWINDRDLLAFVLRDLALPYADHPDYQLGWRP